MKKLKNYTLELNPANKYNEAQINPNNVSPQTLKQTINLPNGSMDCPEAIYSQQASSVAGGDEIELKMEVKSIKNDENNNQVTIANIFSSEQPT